MKTAEKLQRIQKKYCKRAFNDDNYSIGGGLNGSKFASNRHEDAANDAGKLTFGKATQLFKTATGMSTAEVKEVIQYAVPHMEWHHAGKLPKSYGGGMKKTYFLNSKNICDLATNWTTYVEGLATRKAAAKAAKEECQSREARQLAFLEAHATKVERVSTRPELFHQTKQEMNGKYGWFDSTYKRYNLPEYYSGWVFETEQKFHEFMKIK